MRGLALKRNDALKRGCKFLVVCDAGVRKQWRCKCINAGGSLRGGGDLEVAGNDAARRQLLHFHLHVTEQVAAALREEGEGGGMKSEQEKEVKNNGRRKGGGGRKEEDGCRGGT